MPQRRFIFVRFSSLLADYSTRCKPELKEKPFALVAPEKGRIMIHAVNAQASHSGITRGMPLADARAILPELLAWKMKEGQSLRILTAMAESCARYTPLVTINNGINDIEGLWLDMTGGTHLFGTEEKLLQLVKNQFTNLGYHVYAAMADTAGGSWAATFDSSQPPIVPPHELHARLSKLPVNVLRLTDEEIVRLYSLGLRKVGNLYHMPRGPLARRLGRNVLLRLDQALGKQEEALTPFRPPPVFEERAYAPDGIMVLDGLLQVLRELIERICARVSQEGKGIRNMRFQAFCFDGRVEQIEIGTSGASSNPKHLFKLLEEKASKINLSFGAEIFILMVLHAQPVALRQNHLDRENQEPGGDKLTEFVDRLYQKLPQRNVYRVQPFESHLPERQVRPVDALAEPIEKAWSKDHSRPVLLLEFAQPIDVVAPVPDYPPMMFRYKGRAHRIRHAEGPERIEAEWWRQQMELRDYYRLEDENGNRYWIYRLGHYQQDHRSQWYLHGFFG